MVLLLFCASCAKSTTQSNLPNETKETTVNNENEGDGKHSEREPEAALSSELATGKQESIESAENTSESRLSGTVTIYPQQILAHDLIYVSLTVKNETTKPLLGIKGTFGRNGASFLLSSNDGFFYTWSRDVARNTFRDFESNILPDESFISVRLFLEFPEMLTWNSNRKWQPEKENAEFITKCIGTGVPCKLGIGWEGGLYFSSPLLINSRPEKEMASIKKWHSQFGNFLSETRREDEIGDSDSNEFRKWKKAPTIKDYQKFESQLSDGTLKNYIKFRKLLATIPNDFSRKLPTLEVTKQFKDLGDYLDTLHPLERYCLVVSAVYYFHDGNDLQYTNHQKLLYILIPKLLKSDREWYIGEVRNKEHAKILLNSPEPKLNK
jgi:hypothetical protein